MASLQKMCSARRPPASELLAVGGDQVDQPTAGTVGPSHGGIERRGAHGVGQCVLHLVGDLVTSGMDGRTEERHHPVGAGTVVPHGGQRRAHRPGRRPAPTGMDGGEHARGRIDQGEGDAVGHEDDQGDARRCRQRGCRRRARRRPPRRAAAAVPGADEHRASCRGPAGRRPWCRGRHRMRPPPAPGWSPRHPAGRRRAARG